jgi:hypothetical protein
MALLFRCSGGEPWCVPESLVAKSEFLQDVSREKRDGTHVSLPFSFAAATELVRRFADGDDVSRACPLETLGEARRLADYLHLEIPESLKRVHMLLSMETIRSSGVANPFDASACMLLSVDLELKFPLVYVRLSDQPAYERMFWSFVTANASPQDEVVKIIGPEGYATVERCAAYLRSKYK